MTITVYSNLLDKTPMFTDAVVYGLENEKIPLFSVYYV
jgi:hypothetical protein